MKSGANRRKVLDIDCRHYWQNIHLPPPIGSFRVGIRVRFKIRFRVRVRIKDRVGVGMVFRFMEIFPQGCIC